MTEGRYTTINCCRIGGGSALVPVLDLGEQALTGIFPKSPEEQASYDTVCHEHFEYYSPDAVQRILDSAQMRVVDVKMNAVIGGSFAVTAARKADSRRGSDSVMAWLLEQEGRMGLSTPRLSRDFEERVYRHRGDLTRLLKKLVAYNKKVFGYGASTKGNVCSSAPLPRLKYRSSRRSTPTSSALIRRERTFRSFPRQRRASWSPTISLSCPGTSRKARPP